MAAFRIPVAGVARADQLVVHAAVSAFLGRTAGLALHREELPDTEGVADSAASKPFTNWSIRSAPISG